MSRDTNMSRFYQLEVDFENISLEEVKKIVCERFGWREADATFNYLLCEGSLYGGQTEEDAHEEIYTALKNAKPDCRAKTIWTYLEDLPHNEFGDDL